MQYNKSLSRRFYPKRRTKMLVEERKKVSLSLDLRPVSGTLYGLAAGSQPIGTDTQPMVPSAVSHPIGWIY